MTVCTPSVTFSPALSRPGLTPVTRSLLWIKSEHAVDQLPAILITNGLRLAQMPTYCLRHNRYSKGTIERKFRPWARQAIVDLQTYSVI